MIDCLNPAGISPPFARYSHGTSVTGDSKWITTSGQLALNKDGTIPKNSRSQAELCFRQIDAILGEAGASVEHVVKINAFVTDRSHMAGYMEARDSWLAATDHLPASTLMIVSGFTRPEFVVEIEVIAAVT